MIIFGHKSFINEFSHHSSVTVDLHDVRNNKSCDIYRIGDFPVICINRISEKKKEKIYIYTTDFDKHHFINSE